MSSLNMKGSNGKWMIENNINFDDNSEALKDNKHFMHYRESIIDD